MMVVNMLDEELKKFIDEYMDSFLSWDLVVYFHNNFEVKDTISNLAIRLGFKEGDLDSEIRKLAEKGLLGYDRKTHMYNYNPSLDQKHQVEKFISSLSSKEQRLSVLGRLLQKGI
jgi:predicted transcriptional regulator